MNGARDFDPATGRYIESDPIGLNGGINTYTYADDEPISNFDPSGLVSASDEARALGMVPVPPPPQISPAAKALLCKLIKQYNGDMDKVFRAMNANRKKAGWADPTQRQAENFATAAAPQSYVLPEGYQVYQSGAHTGLGVWLYQYIVKPFVYPLFHKPTTPVSDDAYEAGIAGLELYGRPSSDALKWCDDCGNR